MSVLAAQNIITTTGEYTWNRSYIFLISTVASLGGLLFGYDIANISGTIFFFTKHFQLNEFQTGWGVGCISLGAAVGSLIAGKLSDRVGRKKVLLIASVLFALTGVGTGWADTYVMFIVYRILSGIAIGCATVVCPVYIAELSPTPFRGRLVAYYQLAITLGVLLAYLSNYLLLDTGVNNWRWMFSSQSVPAILFFIGLLFVLESPRWLIMKGRNPEAMQILQRIGGGDFALAEAAAIQQNKIQESQQQLTGLFNKKIISIVISGVGLAIFSQLGGPFTAYGPEIFRETGVAQSNAFLQSAIIGAILFLFTIVAILTIDKLGRKKLLLWGAGLLLFITVGLTLAFHFSLTPWSILILALAFTAVYAATAGPVTWVVLSEIFPSRIRGYAMSLATVALWVANFLNISSFPIMRSHFGMAVTFGAYIPLFLIYFFFVYFRIPETKNKSLEEIESILTRETKSVV